MLGAATAGGSSSSSSSSSSSDLHSGHTSRPAKGLKEALESP